MRALPSLLACPLSSTDAALAPADREDKRNQPERYEQAVSWMQTAFPDDWQERKPGPQAALDPDLCGKWKVRLAVLSPVSELHADSCAVADPV